MYYYVYRITDLNPTTSEKYYYGYAHCKCNPKNHLGEKYFSSSSNKKFIAKQKKINHIILNIK